MATPTIRFNNSSGSDTTASGSSGAITANGTNASFAASVVTLDGSPSLAGFDANFDVLWMKTSTGRQFFDLSSADDGAKTVTCVNAPSGTSTGRTWGIGGKRKTFDNADSRTLFGTSGWKAKWIISPEDDQTVSGSAITVAPSGTSSTAGIAKIVGPSGRATITQSANAACFSHTDGNVSFENLKILNSNGTKTSAHGITSGYGFSNTQLQFKNCVFGASGSKLRRGLEATFGAALDFAIYDCLFDSCDAEGIDFESGGKLILIGGDLRDCCISSGTSVIRAYTANAIVLTDFVITKGVKPAIQIDNASPLLIIKNFTLHGNTGASSDGISYPATGVYLATFILNGNITGNGAYGIDALALLSTNGVIDFNNFGTGGTANSSGARNGVVAGSNDLAVDPSYTNASSYDFSVGTSVKAEGCPDASRKIGANPSSGSVSYVDVGAVQRQEAGGSGGLKYHPGMTGHMNG